MNRIERNESACNEMHALFVCTKIGARKLTCPTALECPSACGLRDGIEKFGHFCIDTRLAAAWRSDVCNGLFFRGVRDLLELRLTGVTRPAVAGRQAFSLG
jgi:nitronate monooxygenase